MVEEYIMPISRSQLHIRCANGYATEGIDPGPR